MNLPQTFSLKRTSGKGRGKKMGVPTINFQIPHTFTLPHGIYAGWLIIGNKKYQAAIHFGPRPMFKEIDPSLEAYILNEQITNITETTQLEFVKYIRKVRSFPSTNDMLKRISVDIKEVKKSLTSS